MGNNDDSIVLRLWGKSSPYHPLLCHMIDVGCMAQSLLQNSVFEPLLHQLAKLFLIDDSEMLHWVGLVSALHDIGKCHPLFQGQQSELPIVQELLECGMLQPGDTRERIYKHEQYALEWIRNYLTNKHGWDISTARLASQVLSQHHQRTNETLSSGGIDNGEWWAEQQTRLASFLEIVFTTGKPLHKCNHFDVAGTLLLGIVILADWIASNTEFFPSVDKVGDLSLYVLKSRSYSQDAIKKLGLGKQETRLISNDFCSIWPQIKHENIRPVQSACESLVKTGLLEPGLLIIEAPMGEGKTEAALYTAMQWMRISSAAGLYMALPTAATSNQMYERIQAFLQIHRQTKSVRLLHGMAWLLDNTTPKNLSNAEDAEIASEWFRPAKRGLLEPWAVGTVDQAMMATLKVRYGVLRLVGLAEKILILDEVHAYDAYMTTIIERLLGWCGAMHIPVILLSATLPSEKRNRLLNMYAGKNINNTGAKPGLPIYPLLTHVSPDGATTSFAVSGAHVRNRVSLKYHSILGNWDIVAENAFTLVNNGGCLCIIVNTVDEAQKLYTAIKKYSAPDVDIRLFHARFKAGQRRIIENSCLNSFGKKSLLSPSDPEYVPRPEKAILVATQVLEQSLDLDFDVMITAIPPIDLLFQRLGRLHRHNGRKRPEGVKKPVLHVLIPVEGSNFGKTEHVYEPWILYRTLDVLDKRKELAIPDDIPFLIEEVYGNFAATEEHPHYDAWKKITENSKIDKEKAKVYLVPKPDPERFWLAWKDYMFNEDEDGGQWFSAKTRLGDATLSVLLLDESQVSDIKERMDRVSLKEARELFLNYVAIPSWAFSGCVPATGYMPVVMGEKLLSGYRLIPMKNGKYKTSANNGKHEFEIIDDPELGVLVERVK